MYCLLPSTCGRIFPSTCGRILPFTRGLILPSTCWCNNTSFQSVTIPQTNRQRCIAFTGKCSRVAQDFPIFRGTCTAQICFYIRVKSSQMSFIDTASSEETIFSVHPNRNVRKTFLFHLDQRLDLDNGAHNVCVPIICAIRHPSFASWNVSSFPITYSQVWYFTSPQHSIQYLHDLQPNFYSIKNVLPIPR